MHLSRAYKDIRSLQEDLLEETLWIQCEQAQASRRRPYAPSRESGAGTRSAPAWQDHMGAPHAETGDPVKRAMDPVREILSRLNGILHRSEYASKVFRLVLSQVEQVEGLQAFELEGTYLGDTSGKITVAPAQREAAYFGYSHGGTLYVFPNYNVLDISQAPDRIFEGYRRHEPITSVQSPAVFAADKDGRWLLKHKGQLG